MFRIVSYKDEGEHLTSIGKKTLNYHEKKMKIWSVLIYKQ